MNHVMKGTSKLSINGLGPISNGCQQQQQQQHQQQQYSSMDMNNHHGMAHYHYHQYPNNYNHQYPMNGHDDGHITILQIDQKKDGYNQNDEEVIIYRLPGERLGMALRFDGGQCATETIRRVFVQNISANSPASKAIGLMLGVLREGDQIMQIDGHHSDTLTRSECIALLRDAPVCIRLFVRRQLQCNDQCCQLSSMNHVMSNGSTINNNNNNQTGCQMEMNLPEQQQQQQHEYNIIKNGQYLGSMESLKKIPPPVPPRLATTTLSIKRKPKTEMDGTNGVEVTNQQQKSSSTNRTDSVCITTPSSSSTSSTTQSVMGKSSTHIKASATSKVTFTISNSKVSSFIRQTAERLHRKLSGKSNCHDDDDTTKKCISSKQDMITNHNNEKTKTVNDSVMFNCKDDGERPQMKIELQFCSEPIMGTTTTTSAATLGAAAATTTTSTTPTTSTTMPSTAAIYVDTCQDVDNNSMIESDTDDTNSSVSTIIERTSLNSAISFNDTAPFMSPPPPPQSQSLTNHLVDNSQQQQQQQAYFSHVSFFNTNEQQENFNENSCRPMVVSPNTVAIVNRVLSPFERLEREFDNDHQQLTNDLSSFDKRIHSTTTSTINNNNDELQFRSLTSWPLNQTQNTAMLQVQLPTNKTRTLIDDEQFPSTMSANINNNNENNNNKENNDKTDNVNVTNGKFDNKDINDEENKETCRPQPPISIPVDTESRRDIDGIVQVRLSNNRFDSNDTKLNDLFENLERNDMKLKDSECHTRMTLQHNYCGDDSVNGNYDVSTLNVAVAAVAEVGLSNGNNGKEKEEVQENGDDDDDDDEDLDVMKNDIISRVDDDDDDKNDFMLDTEYLNESSARFLFHHSGSELILAPYSELSSITEEDEEDEIHSSHFTKQSSLEANARIDAALDEIAMRPIGGQSNLMANENQSSSVSSSTSSLSSASPIEENVVNNLNQQQISNGIENECQPLDNEIIDDRNSPYRSDSPKVSLNNVFEFLNEAADDFEFVERMLELTNDKIDSFDDIMRIRESLRGLQQSEQRDNLQRFLDGKDVIDELMALSSPSNSVTSSFDANECQLSDDGGHDHSTTTTNNKSDNIKTSSTVNTKIQNEMNDTNLSSVIDEYTSLPVFYGGDNNVRQQKTIPTRTNQLSNNNNNNGTLYRVEKNDQRRLSNGNLSKIPTLTPKQQNSSLGKRSQSVSNIFNRTNGYSSLIELRPTIRNNNKNNGNVRRMFGNGHWTNGNTTTTTTATNSNHNYHHNCYHRNHEPNPTYYGSLSRTVSRSATNVYNTGSFASHSSKSRSVQHHPPTNTSRRHSSSNLYQGETNGNNNTASLLPFAITQSDNQHQHQHQTTKSIGKTSSSLRSSSSLVSLLSPQSTGSSHYWHCHSHHGSSGSLYSPINTNINAKRTFNNNNINGNNGVGQPQLNNNNKTRSNNGWSQQQQQQQQQQSDHRKRVQYEMNSHSDSESSDITISSADSDHHHQQQRSSISNKSCWQTKRRGSHKVCFVDEIVQHYPNSKRESVGNDGGRNIRPKHGSIINGTINKSFYNLPLATQREDSGIFASDDTSTSEFSQSPSPDFLTNKNVELNDNNLETQSVKNRIAFFDPVTKTALNLNRSRSCNKPTININNNQQLSALSSQQLSRSSSAPYCELGVKLSNQCNDNLLLTPPQSPPNETLKENVDDETWKDIQLMKLTDTGMDQFTSRTETTVFPVNIECKTPSSNTSFAIRDSMINARRYQNTCKLKGLVIPELANQQIDVNKQRMETEITNGLNTKSENKLPTIISEETLKVKNSKDFENNRFDIIRNGNEFNEINIADHIDETTTTAKPMEIIALKAPTTAPIPKYSPMFKRRPFSLPINPEINYGSPKTIDPIQKLDRPPPISSSVQQECTTPNEFVIHQKQYSMRAIVFELLETNDCSHLGIELTGGLDSLCKEVTVLSIVPGSLASRDGRLQPGDRIVSVNGKLLLGLTHEETVLLLQSACQCNRVMVVYSRAHDLNSIDLSSPGSVSSPSILGSMTLPLTPLSPSTTTMTNSIDTNNGANYKTIKAEITKDVNGLGFIIEGGKNGSFGDRPILIKRIFRGGPVDKEGSLMEGDELLTVNEHSMQTMTRAEAWNFLKQLSDGKVTLVTRRRRYFS
ncbi:PDZ domain [Blomia tropicalis]|nr:PDZ domain [Blomia tropicalis]